MCNRSASLIIFTTSDFRLLGDSMFFNFLNAGRLPSSDRRGLSRHQRAVLFLDELGFPYAAESGRTPGSASWVARRSGPTYSKVDSARGWRYAGRDQR